MLLRDTADGTGTAHTDRLLCAMDAFAAMRERGDAVTEALARAAAIREDILGTLGALAAQINEHQECLKQAREAAEAGAQAVEGAGFLVFAIKNSLA